MPDLVQPDEETRHERLRIARDLHDTVAQRLAGLGFALDGVIADEAIPAQRKRALREIRLGLTSVVQELRDEILALRIHPSSSIEEWLRERLAIDLVWQRFDALAIAERQREELQYSLLELIQNAISYQGITAVRIQESELSLTANFFAADAQPTGKPSHSPSLGRVGLRERIIRLGAQLEESDEGFVIRWKAH